MGKLTKKLIEKFSDYGKPACYKYGVGSGGQKVQCYKLDGHEEVMAEYDSASTLKAYALLPAGMWDMLDQQHPVPAYGMGEDDYHDAHEKSVRILSKRYEEDCFMGDTDAWYQIGDSGRLKRVSTTALF